MSGHIVFAACLLPVVLSAAPINVHVSWNGRDDAASTMVIAWQTLNNTTSKVEYGLSTNDSDTVTAAPSYSTPCQRYNHAVKLTNLTANTQYHYRCGNETDGWSAASTFTTGLPIGSTDDILFVAAGDTRIDTPKIGRVTNVKNRIAARNPRLLFFSGDIPREGGYQSADDYADSNWDMWFEAYSNFVDHIPFFSSTGNHDLYGGTSMFTDQFHWPTNAQGNDRWYSVNFGNAHFIALEITGSTSDAPVGSDQYNWLQTDLAQASSDTNILWIFVSFHAPPYCASYHSRNVNVLSSICPLFDQYGVDLVFNGHNHIYERTKKMRNRVSQDEIMEAGPSYNSSVEGVVYIVTGRAGANSHSTNPSAWTAFTDNPLHYLVLDIDNTTGVLYGRAYDIDDTLFDTFTITKNDGPDVFPPRAPVGIRILPGP